MNNDTQIAIDIYSNFKRKFDSLPVHGKMMPYRWWRLPDPMHPIWMPYCQMLEDYTAEISNIINKFTINIKKLIVWDEILNALPDDDKFFICHEFVDDIGTITLGLPYAIRSRFIFAAAHLCHQANRAKMGRAWRDEFPNETKLYLNDIETICCDWDNFREFKINIESIGGRNYRNMTSDYRNAYNHRFSPRLVVGITSLVSRYQHKSGEISYAIGGNEPLKIGAMADFLAVERDKIYKTFISFQNLVCEQIEEISK